MQPQPQAPSALFALQQRPIRVLIVDDHPLIRDGVRARLSSAGSFEVVGEAGGAHDALRLLEKTPVDVVLTDLAMDDVDGVDLTTRVVERHKGVAVVLFTMYADLQDVERAMRAGASGYVLKDEASAKLIDAIITVALGGTYLSPQVAKHLFQPAVPDSGLTAREEEVVELLSQGMSSKQIAKALCIELRTVQTHRNSIKRKLCLEGQAALIKYAVERASERPEKPQRRAELV